MIVRVTKFKENDKKKKKRSSIKVLLIFHDHYIVLTILPSIIFIVHVLFVLIEIDDFLNKE